MDRTIELEKASVLKLLISYSLPAIAGMVINAIYNVVDRMFIGNDPEMGAAGLAGITVCFPIMIIMMAFSVLFGMGGSILTSIKMGEKDNKEAQRVFLTTYSLMIVSGIIIAIVGNIFLSPLLLAFGADSETLPYAESYMRVIFFGGILQNLGLGANNFIRIQGRPVRSMVTMAIGAVVNIILDYIFIFRMGLGTFGAALGTVIGQACTTIFVAHFLMSKKSILRLSLKKLNLNPVYVRLIITYGTSAAILQAASALMNVILNKQLLKYGAMSPYGSTIAISGLGIINSLVTLFVLPVIGINQGVQPIISYNYGAKNYGRIKKALIYAIMFATAFVCMSYAVSRLFPDIIIGLFCSGDEKLMEFSKIALRDWFLMMPIVGYQIVSSNYFQSIGKVKTAIVLSTSRQLLFLIPLLFILPYFMGLEGILYATPVADAGAIILTTICMFFEIKSLLKAEKEEKKTKKAQAEPA